MGARKSGRNILKLKGHRRQQQTLPISFMTDRLESEKIKGIYRKVRIAAELSRCDLD